MRLPCSAEGQESEDKNQDTEIRTRNKEKNEHRHVTLYFDGDSLSRIEGDYFAENPQELIKEATKYKRQYPDDKRPDDDKKKQQPSDQS